MYIVDKTTMRRAEEIAVEGGCEWYALMQNAGKAAAEFISSTEDVAAKSVAILCGKGNNGGDGFVIAKELSLRGAKVTVVLTHGQPATDIAKKAFCSMPDEVEVLGIAEGITRFRSGRFDIVIDAVFGTGYNGNKPDGEIEKLFDAVGFTDYAIDLPSLIACDTGEGWQYAMSATHTLTFGALKLCHILPHSSDRCGEVTCLDIGIPPIMLKEAGATITSIKPPLFIEKRKKTSCKNDYGVALSVCGSYGMSGAAIISAKAALRSGIGILKLACVEQNYTALAISVPEVVLIPCKSQGITYSIDAINTLKEQLNTADALLIGCGFGVSEEAKAVVKELLLSTRVPTVLDADGINLIAPDIELLKDVKAPLVLTPHPGEMARLLCTTSAEIEKNRLKYAADFAKEYGVYTVLKGANTIVASPDGDISVNLIGNAGMATAGSGDMLAGITVALLAGGNSVLSAVKAAVWLHSAAGDAAKNRLGERAMLPTDMIEELPRFL